MAVFALVAGFIRSKIPLLVLRALMGAGQQTFNLLFRLFSNLFKSGGALTIPSAQHFIVHIYPDPEEQARALAIFGGMGGIGIGS